MRGITLLAVVLMAATAQAQNRSIVVQAPPGTYVLTITTSSATVTPATVATVGTPPMGPITPDPITPDPNPTSMTAAVKAAADAVVGDANRAETSAKLAIVYQKGADLIASGQLKTLAQATAWARVGSDFAITARDAWQPARDVIGSQLDQAARKRPSTSMAEYGADFVQVAKGLQSSAGDTSAFDFAAFLEKLMQWLPIILALFGA